MKQLTLLLLAFASMTNYAQSQAQTKSKPSANTTAAAALNKALCECFSKPKELRFKSQEEVGMMIGKCLEESEKTQQLFIGYLNERGVAPDDDAGMREAGREMGRSVTTSCPVLYKAVLELQSRQPVDTMKEH